MATRMSEVIRDSILKKLLTRSYQERVQDLINRFGGFADKVYRNALGPANLRRIEELPKGWLKEDDDITVVLGASHVNLHFNGVRDYGLPSEFKNSGGVVLESKYRPFPFKNIGQVVKVYEASHPLTTEYRDLLDEWDKLKAEIEKASATVEGTLRSVSTVQKLITVWPEVKDIAHPYLVEGERRAILPEVPRKQLNAIFRLPPAKGDEAAA